MLHGKGGGPLRKVGRLLPEALKGLGPGLRRGQVLAYWREAVGPELARLTRALALEEGVLLVAVPDPTLRHQLTYARLELLEKLRARFPEVREIRFIPGELPPEDPPSLGPRPRAELPPAGFPERVQRLARFLREKPGETCPVCGAKSPTKPCSVCRRHLEDPLVHKAAQRLARGRAAGLEGDLLEAARYLARQALLKEMEELFPMALKDPGLIPLLKDLVRRFRALFPEEALPSGVESLAQK